MTQRKKDEVAGANRRESLDCITLGYHMYGKLVYPWTVTMGIGKTHLLAAPVFLGGKGTVSSSSVVIRYNFAAAEVGPSSRKAMRAGNPIHCSTVTGRQARQIERHSARICRTISVGFHSATADLIQGDVWALALYSTNLHCWNRE